MSEFRAYRFLAGPALLLLMAACEPVGPSELEARFISTPQQAGVGTYLAAARGDFHTCALDSAGRASCWGLNDHLQLGVDSASGTCLMALGDCTSEPVQVSTSLRFTRLAAGRTHTCGLDDGGGAWCWGGGYLVDGAGYLGDGEARRTAEPVGVAFDGAFVQLVAGPSFTCGLDDAGAAHCWGATPNRPVFGTTADAAPLPARIPGDRAYVSLTAGMSHVCGLTAAGEAWCWGSNRWGELGRGEAGEDGAPWRAYQPVQATLPFPAAALSAGSEFTCALDDEGAAWCWGVNGTGQLGTGSAAPYDPLITAVAGGHRFAGLEAGALTPCALRPDGAAFCWGSSWAGALGNGTHMDPSTVPVPVSDGHVFESLVPGPGSHSCALKANGELWCWGDNGHGQAGIQTTDRRYSPSPRL